MRNEKNIWEENCIRCFCAGKTHLISYCKSKKLLLYFPELCCYELINVLLIGKKIEQKDIQLFITAIQSLCTKIVLLETKLINILLHSATIHHITNYDAVYINVAQQENAILITADRQHHNARKSNRIIYLDELSL